MFLVPGPTTTNHQTSPHNIHLPIHLLYLVLLDKEYLGWAIRGWRVASVTLSPSLKILRLQLHIIMDRVLVVCHCRPQTVPRPNLEPTCAASLKAAFQVGFWWLIAGGGVSQPRFTGAALRIAGCLAIPIFLDHAEQGREPPDESVTVVVGGGGRGVVRPGVVPPCCCCFCEGTRLDRGNRELLCSPLLLLAAHRCGPLGA